MIGVRWSHTIVVLTAASVFQTGVFDQLWLFGRVRIDLLLLLVLGVGLTADTRTAPVVGFLIGLVVDLFRFGPFGLHALVFTLAAFVLANSRDRMLLAGASFRTLQGGTAAAVLTAATWIGAAVFGQEAPDFDQDTLVSLAWVVIVGSVLVHPAEVVARWMLDQPSSQRRVPRRDVVRVD